MCDGNYTQQTAKLFKTRSHRVTEVYGENVRTSEYLSKYFTCLHSAMSATINCTMLLDHGGNVSSEGATECLRLRGRKGTCKCIWIRWKYPGETIFANDNKTILRPCVKTCDTMTPAGKIFTKQTSTIVTSSHINTSDSADENSAQDNNLLLIIVVVVGSIILVVIFVALVIFIRHRRHTKENCLPNACIQGKATNMVVPDSEPYFTLENAVSNNSNRILDQNQFMTQNVNDLESARFQQHSRHRIVDDTDQGYEAMSSIDKTNQNEDEHYDAIVDDENDSQENVKVKGVSAVGRLGVAHIWDVKNDIPQSSSGEGNVYEGYNETAGRDTFHDADIGSELKHKVQEEIGYTSIQENYALHDTSDDLKQHTSGIRTPCTGNTYENVSFDNTNQNYYGNTYMVKSDKFEHLKEGSNVTDDDIDTSSEGHDHQGNLKNSSGVGDDAGSAAYYSRLHTVVCKRANPYDVLCEGDKEQI